MLKGIADVAAANHYALRFGFQSVNDSGMALKDERCALHCVFREWLDSGQTSELHAVCYAVNFGNGFESGVVTKVHAVKSAMRSVVAPTAVTHKSTRNKILHSKKRGKRK